MDPVPIFDVSCGHSHVDGESRGSKMSLDEELGILSVVTLGVRKSKNVVKTPGSDVGICRSTHVKYPIDRLRYDGFSIHHYAYMVKGSRRTKPITMLICLYVGRKIGT